MATALAPAKVWQGLKSGNITLGRALENDLSMDLPVEIAVWKQAAEAHAAFWHEWASWRHALPGAPGGSFHDIVRMFHFEERLVDSMSLESGDVVVDLGCALCRMLGTLYSGKVSIFTSQI